METGMNALKRPAELWKEEMSALEQPAESCKEGMNASEQPAELWKEGLCVPEQPAELWKEGLCAPEQPAGPCEGGLSQEIAAAFSEKKKDIRTYSPLTLAYIGDAVYDLIIRTRVVERANRPSHELHKITVRYVSAGAQSRMAQALAELFTEEEQAVYRRGKNAKPHTMAKNASRGDYMRATGFEAVVGYLYLTDRMDRILELVKSGIKLAGLEPQAGIPDAKRLVGQGTQGAEEPQDR